MSDALRPLSDHAKGRLRELLEKPLPTLQFNPGVVDRFLRGGLAELVDLPSPYRTHRGKRTAHLQLTQMGRAYLAELDANDLK